MQTVKKIFENLKNNLSFIDISVGFICLFVLLVVIVSKETVAVDLFSQ